MTGERVQRILRGLAIAVTVLACLLLFAAAGAPGWVVIAWLIVSLIAFVGLEDGRR